MVTSMVGFRLSESSLGVFLGWGAIGQHSADRLQEAQVVSWVQKKIGFEFFPFTFVLAFSSLDFFPIQVPILTQMECQEKVQGNETIESSMLCAGGEGSGTNKVGWEDLDKCYYALLLCRGTVGDPSLWRRMASTPWRASPATDCQQFPILRLTSNKSIYGSDSAGRGKWLFNVTFF